MECPPTQSPQSSCTDRAAGPTPSVRLSGARRSGYATGSLFMRPALHRSATGVSHTAGSVTGLCDAALGPHCCARSGRKDVIMGAKLKRLRPRRAVRLRPYLFKKHLREVDDGCGSSVGPAVAAQAVDVGERANRPWRRKGGQLSSRRAWRAAWWSTDNRGIVVRWSTRRAWIHQQAVPCEKQSAGGDEGGSTMDLLR